jgi:hypothetical protein
VCKSDIDGTFDNTNKYKLIPKLVSSVTIILRMCLFNVLICFVLIIVHADFKRTSHYVDGTEAPKELYHAIWSSIFYRCPPEADVNLALQIHVTNQCYASSLKRNYSPGHNRYVNIPTSIST